MRVVRRMQSTCKPKQTECSYLIARVDVGELVLKLRLLDVCVGSAAEEIVGCIYEGSRITAGRELGGIITE